jgi:hypothetical protein
MRIDFNKAMRASITVFVLILLGMSIGLYLFGFQSSFVSEFTQYSNNPSQSASEFLNQISKAIISAFTENKEIFLPMFGFALIAGIAGASYAGGSLLRYLIPVMLFFVVINIFVFPVVPSIESAVTHTEAFRPIVLLLSVIFNALLFLTIFTFVSGED